ncbi:dihydrodipicolinate synthase family protein [Pseudomonas sp. YQ_6]|uniref:dihydrodipicolinate synthase family protein n=1 Tax=Pseudomonas sp. YQ_6 TaxID=3367230 RepID=UPI00370A2184
MFTGLCAFPLTPMNEDQVDEASYVHLISRLVKAGVDSIGALGSTGSYAYLSRAERARLAQLAVEHAESTPVMVSIGSLRTKHVLELAEDAQKAGVTAVLLPPLSYQALNEAEVFDFYKTVTSNLSVPLCVYDNPGTNHFTFSDELHGRIAHLPNVRSIKIPGVPASLPEAKARVDRLRALIPAHVSIGVSGDASAAIGLNAGCEAWYSVIGGLFPEVALAITQAALRGDAEEAEKLSNRLLPLWQIFGRSGGSLRVVAAAAELLSLVSAPSLPQPLRSVEGQAREELNALLEALELS